MNLIIVDRDEVEGGRARLSGRRGQHIVRVLTAKVGDSLRVGVARGPTGVATVVEVDDEHVLLQLELGDDPPTPPLVELVLAMPRPKVLSRVLQTAASFGVARIDIINAWRVDKSYLQSKRLDDSRLHEDLQIGCEQGSTTWLPNIAVHRLMMPFIDERLTTRMAKGNLVGVIAHPHATQHIEDAVKDQRGAIIVAVGPEGGWIQAELDTFRELGFVGVSLGQRILRVDSAVAGLLAQLDMLRRF